MDVDANTKGDLELLMGFWCDGESIGDGGSELMGMD